MILSKYRKYLQSFLNSGFTTETMEVERLRDIRLQNIGLLYALLAHVSNFSYYIQNGSLGIVMMPTTGLITVFAGLYLLRRGVSSLIAGNLMVTSGAIGIFGTSLLSGGLNHPTWAWTFMLPWVAVIMAGRRSGYVWTGIITVYSLVVWYLETQGLYPAPLLSAETLAGSIPTEMLVLCINTAFMISIYASQQHWLEKQLNRTINNLHAEVYARKVAEEEALSAARAKSDFLATMSHEIRTPMNGVIGMTSLLMNTRLDEEQQECVETIHVSGEALLSIINDILDFSKIEAGHIELEEVPFSLLPCLEETLDLLAPAAREKDIELILQVADGVPSVVEGDRLRLKQVLVNLAGNALKFTEDGEVVLAVEKTSQAGLLQFSVRDSGIGIPADRVDTLFDAFTQADTSITRRYGGTGLGLSISKQLVELMGGTIAVESELGKGSCFSFTVKLNVRPGSEPINMTNVLYPGRRLLLIDGHALRRDILFKQLTRWGLLVESVSGLTEARKNVQFGTDLEVILICASEKIREAELIAFIDARAAQTPVICIGKVVSIQLENIENIHFLSKPAKREAIKNTLGKCLLATAHLQD